MEMSSGTPRPCEIVMPGIVILCAKFPTLGDSSLNDSASQLLPKFAKYLAKSVRF